MRRAVTCLWAVCLVGSMYAAEQEHAFAELDAKIATNLQLRGWNHASKVFLKALWEDYKKAYAMPEEKAKASHSIFGKLPDGIGMGYDDYVGAFAWKAAGKAPFVAVKKDAQGRFTVSLEGHTIPAVVRNRTVLFTTGDFTYSPIPALASGPYCVLEMYMLIRTDGRYYFGSPAHPPEMWRLLEKLTK